MKKPRDLLYVTDKNLTWFRAKRGEHFIFVNRNGKILKDKDAERVKALVIPPAWQNVRICPNICGHIQAVGFDDKGRKQYIYHPKWVEFNQKNKFDSLKKFGEVLPILRETVQGHMRQHTLSRERILATIVWLLEHTFIRVGNAEYAKENQSYGLTTMRNKHVDVEGNTVKFAFKGKSNVYHQLDINHHRVAETIKQCIELPGYQLFQYIDEDNKKHKIDSADVNDYLKEISGESFSAKDFRTWGGTTLAGNLLFKMGNPTAEFTADKVIVETVKRVAEHLGNTASVCRTYYIHPKVLSSYQANELIPHFEKTFLQEGSIPTGLRKDEYAVLSLL